MLIRTHMEELKEETNDVLYERYRTSKLTTMGVTQDSSVFKEVKCVGVAAGPTDRAAPPPSWPRSARCTMPVSPRCVASHYCWSDAPDGGRDEDGLPAKGQREGASVIALPSLTPRRRPS